MNPSMYLRIISSGHSRPLAELQFSPRTEDGLFLISACLGECWHKKLGMPSRRGLGLSRRSCMLLRNQLTSAGTGCGCGRQGAHGA